MYRLRINDQHHPRQVGEGSNHQVCDLVYEESQNQWSQVKDLVICYVVIGYSRFGQRNSVSDRCFLCERLQERIVWVQIPLNVKVLLQCRDVSTVVKMSVCVEKCDNFSFNVFGFFQRVCRPMGSRSGAGFNPIDKSLRLIAAIDNDGVSCSRIGDNGTPHLQRSNQEVLNQWGMNAHGVAKDFSFMSLRIQS